MICGASWRELFQERRQQRGFRIVAGHDPKHAIAVGGTEIADGTHQLLHLAQHPAQLRFQGLGSRRRAHTLGGPEQQGIVECLTQALQGIAHRRLGDAEFVCGAGDIGLVQ